MDGKDLLKLTATGLSGLFSGAAMCINLSDHPARMTLDTVNCRQHWKEDFDRAKKFQSLMCVVGSTAAAGAFYLDEGSEYRYLWLLGAGTFSLVFPWTIFVMKPDINKLLKSDIIDTAGETWVREHIARWNSLHKVRTLCSMTAFGIFLYAVSRR